MSSIERYYQLKSWIDWLKEMAREFPSENITMGTALRSFKSQLKELEKK